MFAINRIFTARLGLCLFGLALALPASASLQVSFADLQIGQPPSQIYSGPGGGYFYNGSDSAGGFASAGFWFHNQYTADWDAWSGWAWSTTSDTTTAGFANQYSAISGQAFTAEAYAVAYVVGSSRIEFPAGWDQPVSVQITNTTYAALAMLGGDPFSKRFGGPDGTDPDWFRLDITAIDTNDQTLGSLDFYLADFRFADLDLNYIVNDWQEIDLSPLGNNVAALEFSLSSSDIGPFGMNTPAYFALDSLVVIPEPRASVLILALFAAAWLAWPSRRLRR